MKKDPRLDNVEIEWVPWTEETWEIAVRAFAELLDEWHEMQKRAKAQAEKEAV